MKATLPPSHDVTSATENAIFGSMGRTFETKSEMMPMPSGNIGSVMGAEMLARYPFGD